MRPTVRTWAAVSPGILISLVALTVAVFVGLLIYRRFLANLAPDAAARPVSGGRLTSERLRELPAPWRVVHEIADDRLGGVDHVVVGPPGIIAISTSMTDRPLDVPTADPQHVARDAMLRGPTDDLAQRAGQRCELLARVFWGAPQPDEPAGIPAAHGTVAVEGQRLTGWLTSLPAGPMTAGQIDLAWQAIVTGIGRPDPLT